MPVAPPAWTPHSQRGTGVRGMNRMLALATRRSNGIPTDAEANGVSDKHVPAGRERIEKKRAGGVGRRKTPMAALLLKRQHGGG